MIRKIRKRKGTARPGGCSQSSRIDSQAHWCFRVLTSVSYNPIFCTNTFSHRRRDGEHLMYMSTNSLDKWPTETEFSLACVTDCSYMEICSMAPWFRTWNDSCLQSCQRIVPSIRRTVHGTIRWQIRKCYTTIISLFVNVSFHHTMVPRIDGTIRSLRRQISRARQRQVEAREAIARVRISGARRQVDLPRAHELATPALVLKHAYPPIQAVCPYLTDSRVQCAVTFSLC